MTWSPRQPKKVTECIPQDTRGPKRLWDAPAGWVMRTRGDTSGTRPMEFLCPVHGRFTVEVPRGEDPDSTGCPRPEWGGRTMSDQMAASVAVVYWHQLYAWPMRRDLRWQLSVAPRCLRPSPWSPSTFGIWPSAGEVMS